MNNIIYVSSVILIDQDDRILLAKRQKNKHMADLWEFPGGKLENNELPEETLVRELKEELNIITKTSCLSPFTFVTHQYSDFSLVMYVFICRRWENIVIPKENQELKWVKKQDIKNYPMPEANSNILAFIRDVL